MSALRYSTPGSVRLVDLGPASPAPLRGFAYRRSIPAGRFAVAPSTPDPVDVRRAESLARYARAYRARQRGAAGG